VLILAFDHQQVGEIDARRLEFDPDHSRRKGCAQQPQKLEALGRPEFAADDSLIGIAYPWPSAAAAPGSFFRSERAARHPCRILLRLNPGMLYHALYILLEGI
jgi:hypothetical protein